MGCNHQSSESFSLTLMCWHFAFNDRNTMKNNCFHVSPHSQPSYAVLRQPIRPHICVGQRRSARGRIMPCSSFFAGSKTWQRQRMEKFCITSIWVNYNISLTWNKAILGMISLPNHDSQWGRSEVVVIYPDLQQVHNGYWWLKHGDWLLLYSVMLSIRLLMQCYRLYMVFDGKLIIIYYKWLKQTLYI